MFSLEVYGKDWMVDGSFEARGVPQKTLISGSYHHALKGKERRGLARLFDVHGHSFLARLGDRPRPRGRHLPLVLREADGIRKNGNKSSDVLGAHRVDCPTRLPLRVCQLRVAKQMCAP